MSDTGDQGTGWGTPPPPPGGTPPTPPAPPGWQPPPPGGTPPAPGAVPAPAHGAPPPAPAYPPVPPAYPAQPGYAAYGTYYPQPPRTEGMSIAALVCGIAGIPLLVLCGIGIVPGILGVVFGLIAISRVNRSGGTVTGKGMALAGAICGGVAVLLGVAYWAWVVVSIRTN